MDWVFSDLYSNTNLGLLLSRYVVMQNELLEVYPQNITRVIPRSRHCVLGVSKIKEVKHPKFRCCFWLCGRTKLKNAIWWQLYLLTAWWNQCSACVPVACKFTLVADGNDTYVKTWKAASEQPYLKRDDKMQQPTILKWTWSLSVLLSTHCSVLCL